MSSPPAQMQSSLLKTLATVLIAVLTKRNFYGCCHYMGHFLCGVERIKRFVNNHLHRIFSNLKTINKISALPTPGKIYADAHDGIHQNKIPTIFQATARIFA